jgi:hypothetical protein
VHRLCRWQKEKEEKKSKKIKREKNLVIRVKARKCENYKLKYCLTSSLGILSYAEGSKTTDCQDTVLILG